MIFKLSSAPYAQSETKHEAPACLFQMVLVDPCSPKQVVLDWLDSLIPLQSEEHRALSRTFAARKIFVSILEP